MPKRQPRRPHSTRPWKRTDTAPGVRKTELRIERQGESEAWRLVHPRCAQERQPDLDEVEQMLNAGETDLAIEELRWLLSECKDLLAAHRLLGEIALERGDLALARGHFGYAFDLGRAAVGEAGPPGPLPYALDENRAWHEAAKGLAWCLHELGKPGMARRAVDEMLRWDPADPLGVAVWRDAWAAET